TGRAVFNVANVGANTAANANTGTVTLTGHSADLLLSTLTVGRRFNPSTAGLGATGSFTFDTGTLDVTTIDVGHTDNTGAAAATMTGTLTIGGGTVTVGSGGITLATNVSG